MELWLPWLSSLLTGDRTMGNQKSVQPSIGIYGPFRIQAWKHPDYVNLRTVRIWITRFTMSKDSEDFGVFTCHFPCYVNTLYRRDDLTLSFLQLVCARMRDLRNLACEDCLFVSQLQGTCYRQWTSMNYVVA